MRTDDIVTQISELTRELKTLVEQLVEADEALVYAESDERTKYAREFMSLTGSIELRKQQAILDSQDEKLQSELAAHKVRAIRARIKYVEQAFEAARSISAARRAEFAAEPTGQWT